MSKIHVYLGDEDYATIDSAEELEESIEYVNSLGSAAQTYSANARSATNDEKLQLTVQFASDLSRDTAYLSLLSERNSLETMDDVRAWRGRLNEYTKEYHENLIEENIFSLPDCDGQSYTHIQYSPFVVMGIDSDDINYTDIVSLAQQSFTENIVIDNVTETYQEVDWETTLDDISATSIVNTSQYNGDGIRIGIYETYDADENYSNEFQNSEINEYLDYRDIFFRDSSVPFTNHAKEVTYIAAKLAPSAQYYVEMFESESPISLSWFIAQNCDVVNCSFGSSTARKIGENLYENEDFGYLPHVDGVIDYQAYYNCISVVVSAGNKNTSNRYSNYNPDSEISSPGYAYNAVTVGGVYHDFSTNSVKHHTTSCYVSDEGIMKPNISAVAKLALPGYTSARQGTSFAAPQVTGAIALMLDRRPVNSSFPMRLLAMLTASAEKNLDYTNDIEAFDNETGAGVLNVERFINNLMFARYDSIDTPYDTPIIIKEVELNAGDEIQIAVAWTVTGVEVENYTDNPISAAVPVLTNYELALTGINGSPLAVSCSFLEDSNVELIRYTAGSTGTYEIVVFLGSVMSEDVYIDEVTMVYNIN